MQDPLNVSNLVERTTHQFIHRALTEFREAGEGARARSLLGAGIRLTCLGRSRKKKSKISNIHLRGTPSGFKFFGPPAYRDAVLHREPNLQKVVGV